MKTAKNSSPSHPAKKRARRSAAKPKPDDALHACEMAAASLKKAGDDLAACWSRLCGDLGTSASYTDLLRQRAWCNVLELRLKEQAHALEAARKGFDAVWDDLVIVARAQELFERLMHKHAAERTQPADDLSLLSRAASVLADAPVLAVAVEERS